MSPVATRDEAALDAATMLCNVAIIPPDRVANVAANVSRQLVDHGGLFEIDSTTCHAHLTVYMARIRRVDLGTILARLGNVILGLSPTPVVHSGYFYTATHYYEISYERTKALLAAHEAITESLCSLRYSPGHPVVEDYFGSYSAEQQWNARNFGYDLAGRLYRPHITLTRFRSRPSTVLPRPDAHLSFTANTIGVFRADNLGAAREVLYTFQI